MLPNNPHASTGNHLPLPAATTEYQSGEASRGVIVAVALGAAAILAAAGLYAVNNHGSEKKASRPSTGAEAGSFNDNACADLTFSNAAANALKFNSEAALEKPADGFKGDVAPYVLGQFDKDGPLAGKGDAASLAIVEALITVPAHDGVVFDPKASVIKRYDTKAAQYSAPETGVKAAALDCVTSFDTLKQTASYNPRFAAAGAKLVLYRADRGDGNKITGFTSVNYVAKGLLGGVEFTLRDTNKGLDDFGHVLLSTTKGSEGELFVTGSVVESQSSKQSINQNGQKLTPAEKSKVKATIKAAATGQTQAASNGGASGGTNGTTGKTGTAAGKTPEKQTGPAGGTTSGSGSTPEASAGPTHNTPGGGTVPGGNSIPTPTVAPKPVPTEVPTPTPTVTIVPTTSPKPSPTSLPTIQPTPAPTPKGTEPPCVSNPPYVIC